MSDGITNSKVRLTQAEKQQVKRIVQERVERGFTETPNLLADAVALVVADRKVHCCGRQLACHGGELRTT